MIRAWVDNGLLYICRDVPERIEHILDQDGIERDVMHLKPQHAVEVDGNVIWLDHGQGDTVQPFVDLEKAQINMGRSWPPHDAPKTL